jgi:hypothetical protein
MITFLKRYGTLLIYSAAVLFLLFSSGLVGCAKKPVGIPKNYIPPELLEEDLDIDEALDMLDEFEDGDTSEPLEDE